MLRVSKWYLDCVADNGDAAVLYWASLQWGVVRLHYGAVLLNGSTRAGLDRTTLRPGPSPVAAADGSLHWVCRPLGVRGDWSPRAPSLDRTLAHGPGGTVHWHCASPRAEATVQVGGRVVQGWGYVEQLTMTLPPWRLPFRELRWGRFVASTDSLVWIEWRGSPWRTWVFVNGVERSGAVVGEGIVELPADRLALRCGEGHVLRSGRLTTTALRPLRLVMPLLPGWHGVEETKWLARGVLTGPDGACTGWVLHEVVRWR